MTQSQTFRPACLVSWECTYGSDVVRGKLQVVRRLWRTVRLVCRTTLLDEHVRHLLDCSRLVAAQGQLVVVEARRSYDVRVTLKSHRRWKITCM